MRRSTILALCLLLTALAGCTDPSADTQGAADAETPAGPAVPPAQPPSTPRPETVRGPFAWTASAAAPGVPVSIGVSAINNLEIEVAEGVTQLDVVADWGCAVPVCPVHVYLYAPGQDPLGEATADAGGTAGPIEFAIEAPDPGTWYVLATPEVASAAVEGTFEATLTR